MEKRLVLTPETGKIVVEVEGNLRAKGVEGNEIIASADVEDDLTLETMADGAYIRCERDCTLRVPSGAKVQATVQGNAVFKSLEGELKIEAIEGNLELRSVGNTDIRTVEGNLEAKNIMGPLQIGNIEGNVNVRDLQGTFNGENISGNLVLEDADGSVVAKVNGNIVMRLDPVPGNSYDFRADGNIVCKLADDASVRIHIAEAARVMVNLPGSQGMGKSKLKPPADLTLGDGDAALTLSADGNIMLASQAPSWEAMPESDFEFSGEFENIAASISQQVTQQMQAHMDILEQQLNSQLGNLNKAMGTAGLSAEEAERARSRAQEASQRAMERAQEKMRRSQERMERKMASIQQRAERRTEDARSARQHRQGFHFGFQGGPPPPPPPPIDPVTEEERMLILKMLEQKQISLEQAEKLLSALEGND